MAASNSNKSKCFTCQKEKPTFTCPTCSNNFCSNHLNEHNRDVQKQMNYIENHRHFLKQNINELKRTPAGHPLFEQINQWERRSIQIIQQTATEARDTVFRYLNEHISQSEINLNQLTQQLKDIREQNRFNESFVLDLTNRLNRLEEQLNRPENIFLREDFSSSFVNKISVIISSDNRMRSCLPTSYSNRMDISNKLTWNKNGTTVVGGNGQGSGSSQLSDPLSICIDDNQSIYVADTWNHRIVKWERDAKKGEIVAGKFGPGDRNDQLSNPMSVIIDQKNDFLIIADRQNKRVLRWPCRTDSTGEVLIANISCRGLTMDNYGYIYASDEKKHEVKRWKIGEKHGTLVAGGNSKGDRFNQFNEPRYIFVDQEESVYVSDWGNHRVMKWMKGAKEGIVVAGGHGEGNQLRQLAHPNGIYVDQFGTLYVVDSSNDRIVRWMKGAKEGEIVIGGNGRGQGADQLNSPRDLCFDQQNNLYVLNNGSQCVRKHSID